MDEKTRQHSLKVSFLDGIFASITLGFTANYTTPFALVLGAKNFHIGLLNAIPQLVGAFSQLTSADIAERTRSRVRFITYAVMGQALIWLVIGVLPYLIRHHQNAWFIALLTVNTVFGAVATPAWASLMSDTVESAKYGRYFAWRGRALGFISLVSNLLAGVWLYSLTAHKYLAFAVLLVGAGFCRIISGYFVSVMTDVPVTTPPEKRFNYLEFIRRLPASNFVKFTMFVAGVNLATFLVAPFFAVYMLRELNFTYTEYALVNTTAALAGLLGLPLWGKFADRYGNVRILRIAALFLPILPVFWLISSDVIYLIVVNAFAGYIWSGFNLCAVNFIFDAASPAVRTRCFGYFNFTNGIAVFTGALLGGYIVNCLPPARLLTDETVISNLLTLFLLSGLLRILVNLVGLNSFKEVRPTEHIADYKLYAIILGLKPMFDLGQSILFMTHRRKSPAT